MSRETTTGLGRWRQAGASRPAAPTGPTATSKWTGAAALSVLLLAALAIAGWIFVQLFFPSPPKPYFVPFWVGAYQKPGFPPIPWRDADRTAIRDAQVFTTVDSAESQTVNPTLEVMKTRLDDLPNRRSDDAVVVYLAASALVDHDGKVQILATDSRPYEPGTHLPLSLILGRLEKCPVKNKLLVLDIMRGMVDPRDVGGTADGVGDLVRKELRSATDSDQFNDPNLLVLTACSPGQVALGSETLRHSVFGYYFHQALTTAEADVNGDHLLRVRELADYLARNVDAWALHYRGVHQQPDLLGPQGRDFVLAKIKESRPTQRGDAGKAPSAGGEKAKEPAADQDQDKEKDKNQGEDKVQGKAKADGKGAAKDRSESGSEPDGAGYPGWLADGWATIERWRNSDDFQAAPRVYRRLARRLMLAEARWRGGDRPEQVRSALDADLRELGAAMDQAQSIPQPDPRSVGQARVLQGWRPDPALTAALAGLLKQRHDQGETPELQKAVPLALAPFKDKTSLDLAGALIAAAGDEVLDAPTLAFLDGLVQQSKLPRNLIELRFLHQLALRAGRSASGDWRSETARTAWNTVLLAEQANNQPRALAWVRAALDQADASLHEAQILLLPDAAGFAGWDRPILPAWDDAREKYQGVADRQRAIRDGQTVLAQSLAALVCLIPYLEATHQPQLQSDWREAAAKAGRLAQLLEPPQPQDPPVEGLGSQLSDATRQLELPLRNLLRPFQHDAVEALVRQCRSESVPLDPSLAWQIEALLTTPFLMARDRPVVWAAGRALDARLSERPMRKDADTAAAGRGEPPSDRARRRFERMAAFLELAGDEKSARILNDLREIIFRGSVLNPSSGSGARLGWDMSDPVQVWKAMARCAEIAYGLFEQRLNQGHRGDTYDRMGWLAPVYVAGFDDWPANPVRRGRERDALAAWSWLAGHYRHRSRDLHELVDPDNFLNTAAQECPTRGPSPPEVYPRIDGPATRLSLSAKQPSATVALSLRLAGADAVGPQKAVLGVVKSDDPRFRVQGPEPAELELAPENPTPATLTVAWSDDGVRTAALPPAGFFVRARMPDQRVYHALVPLAIVTADMFPSLALSSDPAQCDDLPMDHLRLRPIAGVRQPFYVFVKNPSPKLWKVIVEVREGDKLSASTSTDKPLEVPAHASLVVKGFTGPAPRPGEPPRKPDAPLPELAGPLRLRLRAADGGAILDEQPIQLSIAAPREYLEVRKAQYAPAAPGQPNRVTVELRALPQMTGPPCKVELVLPLDKDLFPALLAPPKDGTLTGTLETGKPPVTLYAEKIALGTSGNAEGSFYLNVDGVKRALWFRSRFPEVGGPQRTVEPREPRVRFHPVRLVESGKPARLRVEFEVDNAPTDARLAFRLGHYQGRQFRDDLERWSDAAKRRHIGFDPKGEGGALLFEASVEDWVREWPVPGLLGPRMLQARLLDAAGRRVLDSHELELVLDDQKPRDMALEVPERIDKGTRLLPVKASATPPAAKIKEVAFFFGLEADFAKAEAAGQVVVKKQPDDPAGRSWSATLPVPKEASGKLVVTARFKTGVDLVAFAPPAEVAVIEPKDEEKAAKPAAPPKPGAIEGIVQEADRAQPGLDVYLVEPNPPKDKSGIKKATTDAKGAFSFPELEAPKQYRLYCAKQGSDGQRVADKQVTVEPGQTVKVSLELLR